MNNENNFNDFNYGYEFEEDVRPPDSVKVDRLIGNNMPMPMPMQSLYEHYENDIQNAIQRSLQELNTNIASDSDIEKAIEISNLEFEFKEDQKIQKIVENLEIENRKNTFIVTKQQLNRLILFDTILNKAYYELLLGLIELFETNISWELGITNNYWFAEGEKDRILKAFSMLKLCRIPENELIKLKQLVGIC